MIVPALIRSEGEAYLEAKFAQPDATPTARSHEIGAGDREQYRLAVRDLRQDLDDLKTTATADGSDVAFPSFDAEAAVALLIRLDLEPRITADDDFWRYLACVELFDLILWRHGSTDRVPPVAPGNFGIDSRWDCYPRRLWFRAELSRDPRLTDPFAYTRRGSIDFWASGMLRHLYTCNRHIARALVRFQYPEAGEFIRHGAEVWYRPQTLTLTGIRELYKRLRHFNSTISMAAISEDQAEELVASLAEGLPHEE